jgi:ssDNA-binding Zn-finger/Zn-ribbon topoisomerase 1
VTFRYEEVKCPECNGEMIARTGQYGKFWGCKKFPECRGTRDSQGRSKQDRAKWKAEQAAKKEIIDLEEEIARDTESEWPRNEQDKIRWKK